MESVRQNLNSPLALFILLLPLKVKRLVHISGSGGDRTQSADTKMQPNLGRVYWTCVQYEGFIREIMRIENMVTQVKGLKG